MTNEVYGPGTLTALTGAIQGILGNDPETAQWMAGTVLALNETMLAESQLLPVPEGGFRLHWHASAGQEEVPCLCAMPDTYARQAPNPLEFEAGTR